MIHLKYAISKNIRLIDSSCITHENALKWVWQNFIDNESKIDSDNDFVISGTNQLPKPMITKINMINQWCHAESSGYDELTLATWLVFTKNSADALVAVGNNRNNTDFLKENYIFILSFLI